VGIRVRTEGKPGQRVFELDDPPKLAKTSKHSIDVVVDRVKVSPAIKQRLAESYETALRIAEGRAVALEMDGGREHLFSNRFACPICSHASRWRSSTSYRRAMCRSAASSSDCRWISSSSSPPTPRTIPIAEPSLRR
jgi:excinuclease UvrABC ATPase subunit